MAKKATPKDYQVYSNWQEAQNLRAHGSRGVPNKPVAASGKKTVPEVLDWGKGIPKDYLAYLNKQEMALVQNARKFKGKRSYMGIPAYPDPGDTAAGDTGQGTSSSSGLGNNTSPGNYHSTDTRYGNSTGNSTAGAGTGGGSDSGSNGFGGGGGADSGANGTGGIGNYGGTQSSDSTNTPSSTVSSSADTSARQAAAESDASVAVGGSPAFRSDAAKGGIRSIGIGPENNKINITNPSESSISGAISRSASSAYKDVTPTSPGGGGMGQTNARRGSETVAVGPTSGTSAPGNIDRGSIYGTDPRTAARQDSLQADMDRYTLSREAASAPSGVYGPRATGSVPSYMSTASMPGMITTGMPSDYSVAGPSTMAPAERSVLEQAKIDQMKEQYRLYGESYNTISPPPNVPTSAGIPSKSYYDKLRAYDSPYGPELSAMRGSAIEAQMVEDDAAAASNRPTHTAGTYTTPYNAPSPITKEEQRSLDRQNQYLNSLDDDRAPPVASAAARERLNSVFASHGIGSIPETEDTPSEETVSDSTNPLQEDSGPLPPGVSPYQDEAVYPEETPVEKYIAKNLPYAKYFAEGMDRIKRKQFENMTPEERNAEAAAWVAANERIKQGDISGQAGRGQGGQDSGSRVGILALEAQERMRRNREAAAAAAAAAEANAEKDNTPKTNRELYNYGFSAGDRPYKYYQWDLGMRVPKPGDPDYNEYRYYLRQRRVDYA